MNVSEDKESSARMMDTLTWADEEVYRMLDEHRSLKRPNPESVRGVLSTAREEQGPSPHHANSHPHRQAARLV